MQKKNLHLWMGMERSTAWDWGAWIWTWIGEPGHGLMIGAWLDPDPFGHYHLDKNNKQIIIMQMNTIVKIKPKEIKMTNNNNKKIILKKDKERREPDSEPKMSYFKISLCRNFVWKVIDYPASHDTCLWNTHVSGSAALTTPKSLSLIGSALAQI